MSKEIPIVETAIALNMIYDLYDRIRTREGATLTPENIRDYIAERETRREALNKEMGILEPAGSLKR